MPKTCPHCKRDCVITYDRDRVLFRGCTHLIGVHIPTMEPIFREPRKRKPKDTYQMYSGA